MMTGLLDIVSVNFTLHTELRTNPPEFTISCLTHGGPATTVTWSKEGENNITKNSETSQLVLNTTQTSVYDNRLRVRGRRIGVYNCIVNSVLSVFIHGINTSLERRSENVTGKTKEVWNIK